MAPVMHRLARCFMSHKEPPQTRGFVLCLFIIEGLNGVVAFAVIGCFGSFTG